MRKFLIYFAISCAAAAAFILLRPEPKPKAKPPSAGQTPAPKALILGNPKAKLTIVAYGDFQCPRCNKFFTTIEPRIREDFLEKDLVKIEWRNFASIGPESTEAAQAAHCANDQQFFPQFYATVFNYMNNNFWAKGLNGENVGALSRNHLKQLALNAYDLINPAAFNKCLDLGKYAPTVKQELDQAKADGFSLNSYVVGKQIVQGVQPYAIFRPVIQSQL